MSFTETVFSKVAELLDAAKNAAQEAAGEAFLVPSDEPLVWEREGLTKGVVRVDVAKMAAHLYAGTICQRVVPFILRFRLDQTILAIDLWLEKNTVSGRGMPSWGRWVLPLISEIGQIWGGGNVEREIEKAIRETSLKFRRELLDFRLGKDKPRIVKTAKVYTRRRSPKQRKPNESWTPPKK